MPTESAAEALAILRDPSQFQMVRHTAYGFRRIRLRRGSGKAELERGHGRIGLLGYGLVQ